MAWADLVRALLKGGELDRADKALDAWSSAVNDPAPIFEKFTAELAFARQEYRGARAAWEYYLVLNPKDATSWTQLSEVYAIQGDWNNAINAIGEAVRIKPDAHGFARRADFQIRLHNWTGAGNDLKQAARFGLTNGEIQKLLPIFERANQWLPVMQKLDAGIANDPTNVSLLLDRAEWLLGLGFRGAGEDDVRDAFKLAPNSLRARVWHGVLEKTRGRSGRGVVSICLENMTPEFEDQLKKQDASQDPEARGLFLLKYHEPLLALNEVKDQDGSVAKALAFLELKWMPDAGTAARRAVEMHPHDAQAWFALANVEFEIGNQREASAALDHYNQQKKTDAAFQKTIQRRLK